MFEYESYIILKYLAKPFTQKDSNSCSNMHHVTVCKQIWLNSIVVK